MKRLRHAFRQNANKKKKDTETEMEREKRWRRKQRWFKLTYEHAYDI